ncbi:sensor histidine kinase [Citricoccus muralis]|uniref:histidine kinase n=1 Tax=Citricoccus muralis TaxID=169134 RepID=A0ABY8H6H0_9MICC|nr:histidine kinase [Citricoccus muralis]WFP16424.1 histidine kinase [Citricoccus muralis]
MNPLRAMDQFSARHPVLVDGCVAGLLWLVLGPVFTLGYAGSALDAAWMLVLSLAQALPWAVRRVRPVTSASITVGAFLLQLFTGPPLIGTIFFAPLTVHNLAVRAPRWASRLGLIVALGGAVAYGFRFGYVPFSTTGFDGVPTVMSPGGLLAFIIVTLLCGAVVTAAWAFGDLARTRRLALQQTADRARQLEIEAAQERELAAADERNHIAREMHDIVAHSLQVIISQADGGRYAGAANPQVAVDTLETIGTASRDALAEMRRLLGVLRGPEQAEHRPQPTLADLPGLIETVRLTGISIDVASEGEARGALAAGGELVAYRVVQEALTNAARHAGPRTQVQVEITWTAQGIHLRIDDDGRGAAAQRGDTTGAGQGLLGMRERVGLYGGVVSAGPRPGGGFRVDATIPYQET